MNKYNIFAGNSSYTDSASFWKRAGAFIIDLFIVNLIILSQFVNNLSSYFGGITAIESMSGQVSIPSDVYIMVFVMMILIMLYFTFFDYYLAQTPGQMILNIKVLRIEYSDANNSKDINIWRALLRNCFILPFFPFYIFWIIEPIYLALYNERLLERLSGTRTIDLNSNNKKKIKNLEHELKKV